MGRGDLSAGSLPEAGGGVTRVLELPAARKKPASDLHFVDCSRRSIDAAEPGRFETRNVTLIYLSFTNGDISIALPGDGVTLEGGARAR